MTYIVFFDHDPIENIWACLSGMPDEIIFLGSKRKQMLQAVECYQTVFSARRYFPKVSCISVNKNDLGKLVEALSQIVTQREDCAFDLTGGDDLMLVAMGIVWERYQEKGIRAHRFDPIRNIIIDCDQDGVLIPDVPPQLTVGELIALAGGTAHCSGLKLAETNGDRLALINLLWSVCSESPRHWNELSAIAAMLSSIGESRQDPLTVSAWLGDLPKNSPNAYQILSGKIMKRLCEKSLITGFSLDDETVSFRYKDALTKDCLTKAGTILEYKLMAAAAAAKDKNGSPLYYDIQTGVSMSWDDDSSTDVVNEVDVVLLKGCLPVFISCKNGLVDTEELYKLNTVADRFGGQYVKKVLAVSDLQRVGKSAAEKLRLRAESMGIRVIDKIQELTDAELVRVVNSLWSN